MTPPKHKQQNKHRPATVVYQRMTPRLILAYRIFSPGLADEEGLEKLNAQMHRIIDDVYVDEEEVVVEDGKKMRKGVGMLEDIKRQMNVTEQQITEAYDAYKAEIQRMIEEDQAHLVAKARGKMPEENGVKRGTKRKSSSASPDEARRAKRKSPSSPIQATGVESKSLSDVGVDGSPDNNNNDDEESEDMDEDYEFGPDTDEDQNELHEVPTDRWMTKTEALSKLSDAQQRVNTLYNSLDLIHDFYTIQMIPRHKISETFQSAYLYMTRLCAYVQEISEIVEGHDGEEREGGERNFWGDDRTAVTRLVLRLIPMVDEIPLRLAAMEGIMEEVSWLTDQLAKVAVEPTRKKFQAKLAEFVKQAHTPVPPPYCKTGRSSARQGERAKESGAIRRPRNVDSEQLQALVPAQGCRKGAAPNNQEVITIDDD
ncbi:hypothetical protein VP1G_00827 [Cytospora mali]|uniref:Uncharacterized protein n=1 Tax=Cytospora mali TaxID=578113 RepID=A0A194UNX8_CYTMA|nr:hypothetical protein VP1G_00827 [Valsa mali var. pyri (nom. inval.)]